jgi:signal transduction histidine kinase/HPt (histidine-containing phosphotransfer) domain-containing protein/ActR/RegA family two-component response regulator
MSARAIDGRGAPSLRRLLAILLAVLGFLVGGLLVVASLQVSGSAAQTRAENRRISSFLLADSLRQSSNDLTNMVRLYVATGRSTYRDYYQQILGIRAGTAPRPHGYDSSFWDRVLAQGQGFIRYGPAESLIAEMRAARFAPDEFRALQDALAASNDLAQLERSVMARTAGIVRQSGVGPGYSRRVAPLYQRLVDQAYLAQKGVIMAAIQRFIALVNARTLREVQQAHAHNRHLASIEIAILVAIVLVGLGAMAVLTRVALRPLDKLIGATKRIAGGDYAERVDVRAVSELERVAGAFNAMAGAVQADVAAREHAEREALAAKQVAEHANRAKTTFLAAMSHEIRTPMIGVTGMLEVLARTDLTAQQRQMVQTAESSAASLLQIIGDILDFSKIEADKLELAPTTFSLEAIVRTAVETFVHTASAKGLLLTWSADEALAPAHVGDPLRVRQIVSNLLSNAVKFTEAGGIEVALRVKDSSAEAQTVEVAVIDTGIGIELEHQARLFADFSQADAATARRYGGTGLGLVICKRLAILMGGDINLQSTPGSGTTISLVAPFPIGDVADLSDSKSASTGARPTSRPKPTREQAQREGSLLLLAEDHPINRTVLGQQLDLIGFQVDFAEDGQEAYERWLTGRYALLFTDLNMPRLDGYQLARRIRARERETDAARTPIVALSANVMTGEPNRCRAAGMNDFAAKPTTIPALASRLQRWLPHLDWPVLDAQPASAFATGAPPAAGRRPMLDAATLDALTGGDTDLAECIVEDFLQTSRDDLRALHEALEACDVPEVRRHAHRIKGAARIVGARDIERAAEQIESSTAPPDRDGVARWEVLEDYAARIGDDLERLHVQR